MHYGRYQIIKEVGRGSMGVVFQCRDPHIDRLVAVKVLRRDRVDSHAFVRRFLKEAKVIGRLTHPNIVAIYDVGEEQETVYIAMEFLEGEPLSEVMRGRLFFSAEVVALGVQLAEALDYAHQKGVVHRDVKPSNIVLQADGQVKITDFGIAHVDDASATLQTQAGEIIGTPAYMSPEQVLSKPVDGRSDLFSLGIILYELTTGRRPFGGESKSLVTVFNDIVETTPPEPIASDPDLPGELSRLIMKALQKDPAKRFQTGREFSEALKGTVAPPQAPRVGKAPGRHLRYARAAGVSAAVSLICLGGYLLTPRKTTAPGPFEGARLSPGAGGEAGPAGASLLALPAPPPPAPPALPAAGASPPAVSDPLSGYLVPRAGRKVPVEKPGAAPPSPDGKPKRGADNHRPAGLPPRPKPRPLVVDPAPPVPRKAREPARLTVESSPSGALVFLNGNQVGTTPVTLFNRPAGEYQIRLSRPGYLTVERQVTLESARAHLYETLKPVE